MRELHEDLFKLTSTFDAICIPTNATVNDGEAMMTTKCAKTCAERWPQVTKILGKQLVMSRNNIPFMIGMINKENVFKSIHLENASAFHCRIFSLPTNNRHEESASMELIKQSCVLLVEYANQLDLKFIAMPRIGAGSTSKLSYRSDVKPLLEKLLDDRFTVVDHKK